MASTYDLAEVRKPGQSAMDAGPLQHVGDGDAADTDHTEPRDEAAPQLVQQELRLLQLLHDEVGLGSVLI